MAAVLEGETEDVEKPTWYMGSNSDHCSGGWRRSITWLWEYL